MKMVRRDQSFWFNQVDTKIMNVVDVSTKSGELKILGTLQVLLKRLQGYQKFYHLTIVKIQRYTLKYHKNVKDEKNRNYFNRAIFLSTL